MNKCNVYPCHKCQIKNLPIFNLRQNGQIFCTPKYFCIYGVCVNNCMWFDLSPSPTHPPPPFLIPLSISPVLRPFPLFLSLSFFLSGPLVQFHPSTNSINVVNNADIKFLLIPCCFLLLRVWTQIMVILFVYAKQQLPTGVTRFLIYAAVSKPVLFVTELAIVLSVAGISVVRCLSLF